MNLAIFDIDGILTETNAVDEICFVQAFADAHAITEINTNWTEYEYVTDSGIMFQIFDERFGRPPDEDELMNFKSCLVNLLEAQREKNSSLFVEISGASRTLTGLNRETEWAVALATGCWRDSADLKLKAAGIPTEHFPAAFAEHGADVAKLGSRHCRGGQQDPAPGRHRGPLANRRRARGEGR